MLAEADVLDHGEASLVARKFGRKAADPRDREGVRLKKANARLEKRAFVAEQQLDRPPKCSTCSRPTTASRNRKRLAVIAQGSFQGDRLSGSGVPAPLVLPGSASALSVQGRICRGPGLESGRRSGAAGSPGHLTQRRCGDRFCLDHVPLAAGLKKVCGAVQPSPDAASREAAAGRCDTQPDHDLGHY